MFKVGDFMCKFGSAGRIILCHFISLESNTSDFYDQWIFMIFIVSARHLEFSPKLWKSSHISSEADTFLSHNIPRRYSFDGANNGENFISRDTTIFLWQHLEKSNLNPVQERWFVGLTASSMKKIVLLASTFQAD